MKKLTQLLKESQDLDYRRMNVGEEETKNMTKEEKRAFVEAVAAYHQLGEMISHKGNISEIHDSIKGIVENANNLTLKETGNWFDRVTVQRNMKSMNESFKVFSNTIKEVSTLQQRLESSYDEIGEVLGKYYEIKEGNAFGAAVVAAKKAGEDEFEVGGKTFKVEESVNEGKKRFKQQDGIGSSKYTISYHDGKKKHKDGSDFFDIQIFKNKPELEAFKKDLVSKGFVSESVNEAKSTKKGNTYYVDSDFVNLSKKGGNLKHLGMGDFAVDVDGGGTISFDRVSEKMPGFSGRTHKVVGNGDDFKKLTKLMGIKSESVNEENKPTNPALWSRAKAAAKAKYDVYPSAYANAFASKWYKEKGGSWRTENVTSTDMEEGNTFGAERAKAIAANKDSFKVDGKTYKVTGVDAEDKKNAKEFANESMKLTSMLKKNIN